jgi:hypothetical protein
MANKEITNPCVGGGTKPEGVVIPFGSRSVAQCAECGGTITVNKANGLFRKHNAAFEIQPVIVVPTTDSGSGEPILADTTPASV